MKKDIGNKILSLILVLIMLACAAVTVNKTLFGHKIESKETAELSKQSAASLSVDTVTMLPDGVEVIHTAAVADSVLGFAGPVPLDIYISDGKITKIEALPNAETPSFFERASQMLDIWVGHTPQEALDLKVDGITGATYSSSAITANVSAGLDAYLGIQTTRKNSMPWKVWVALAVTLAACIVPLFVKSKIYHTVQMIANVVVLGFWCGLYLDYALMLKYMSEGFLFPAGLAAIVMLIAAFIYPLFGRPQHYCNHICPLGSAQQLVAQVCSYKIKISKKALKGLDWFRRFLWAVLMLLLWADCLTSWMDLELFQAFQFSSASWWIIGAALLFVALSAVVARPYCRFVCPTGSLFKRAENFG